MTSFPAAARRVRDADRTLHDRLLSLRECVLHFAPYGFRATWHHLVVSAGIPRRLEDNPRSLDRALAELERAREIWQADREAYVARRRREKRAGHRIPGVVDRRHGWTWRIAYCPFPDQHPREDLAVVVGRLIDAYNSGGDWSTVCPVCGNRRAATEACPSCGVDLRIPTAPLPPQFSRAAERRWRLIWQREVLRPTQP